MKHSVLVILGACISLSIATLVSAQSEFESEQMKIETDIVATRPSSVGGGEPEEIRIAEK